MHSRPDFFFPFREFHLSICFYSIILVGPGKHGLRKQSKSATSDSSRLGEKMFQEKEGAEEARAKRLKEKSELIKKAAEQCANEFAQKQEGDKA